MDAERMKRQVEHVSNAIDNIKNLLNCYGADLLDVEKCLKYLDKYFDEEYKKRIYLDFIYANEIDKDKLLFDLEIQELGEGWSWCLYPLDDSKTLAGYIECRTEFKAKAEAVYSGMRWANENLKKGIWRYKP